MGEMADELTDMILAHEGLRYSFDKSCSTCRYCGKRITWVNEGTERHTLWRPYGKRGIKPHNCRAVAAPGEFPVVE